jgi:hypothetical protein
MITMPVRLEDPHVIPLLRLAGAPRLDRRLGLGYSRTPGLPDSSRRRSDGKDGDGDEDIIVVMEAGCCGEV